MPLPTKLTRHSLASYYQPRKTAGETEAQRGSLISQGHTAISALSTYLDSFFRSTNTESPSRHFQDQGRQMGQQTLVVQWDQGHDERLTLGHGSPEGQQEALDGVREEPGEH